MKGGKGGVICGLPSLSCAVVFYWNCVCMISFEILFENTQYSSMDDNLPMW